jgi:cation diffusion facilitator CzcD-associated flavoprotein CzcO
MRSLKTIPINCRYPGCQCDIPAHNYAYSFAANPAWPNYYATSLATTRSHMRCSLELTKLTGSRTMFLPNQRFAHKSHNYAYSFAANPAWPNYYATSEQIHSYMKDVAKHQYTAGIDEDITFVSDQSRAIPDLQFPLSLLFIPKPGVAKLLRDIRADSLLHERCSQAIRS